MHDQEMTDRQNNRGGGKMHDLKINGSSSRGESDVQSKSRGMKMQDLRLQDLKMICNRPIA